MGFWSAARGAATSAQPLRDAAYGFAGKGIRKSARNVSELEQRQRGRRRLAYGGGALGVQQVASRGRGSSGRDGIQPHSMGGTTL